MAKSGYRKARKVRPNERTEDGYDSKFERNLHKGVLKSWQEHGQKLAYYSKHEYHPDFVKVIDGITWLIEAKGRFWDSAEYSKYLWIRESLPEDYKLIFVFMKPNNPMPRAKMRKCGTKRTMADWADHNNFEHYTMDNFPKELR